MSYLKTEAPTMLPLQPQCRAEAIVGTSVEFFHAAWLQGEYGFNDLYLGVPCMLGANGLERIVEVELEESERSALETSAEHVKSTVESLKAMEASS